MRIISVISELLSTLDALHKDIIVGGEASPLLRNTLEEVVMLFNSTAFKFLKN